MISCSVLILLLLVECCPANKRDGSHYDPTSPPRGSGGKSTHISEFTDPATGLNPFLDIEEGLADEMGRNIVEEDEVQPRPLSDSDLQLIEGGPYERVSHWNEGFGRRRDDNLDKSAHINPISSAASDATETEQQVGNRRYSEFSTATEASSRNSPHLFVPSIRDSNSGESEYYSLRPAEEDHDLGSDYNTEYHQVEGEVAVVQEDITHPKKVPVSKNVLISAAIIGASLALIALLLAICWWRQKMKRLASQGSASSTGNNIESIISDKLNTNIQKKSISA